MSIHFDIDKYNQIVTSITPRFRECHSRWVEALCLGHHNSIDNQVIDLAYLWRLYLVFRETRRLSKDRGASKNAAVIHHFVDRTFIPYIFMAIRRQLDASKLIGPKSVYSIMAVIRDMADHSTELTRSNLLLCTKSLPRTTTNNAPELVDAYIFETRWSFLDILLDQKDQTNSLNDRISDERLAAFKTCLESIDQFKVYVDKRIAHAASRESESLIDPSKLSIKFGEIERALRVLCAFRQFLHSVLLQSHAGIAPISMNDPISGIDQALMLQDEMSTIRKFYTETTSKIDGLSSDFLSVIGIV